MDLALLGRALSDDDSNKGRVAVATAAVLGVTALDLFSSLDLTRNGDGETRAVVDFSRSITIDRPAQELYGFWRNFENLPMFMRHLESVRVDGDRLSHWVARGPLGRKVEWDAEITEDRPDELISWRSLGESDVENSGSVRFMPATGGRGNVVQVRMEYKPPAGVLGSTVARLFGEEPELQITDDLRAFKQTMELGEVVHWDGNLEGGHLVQHPGRPAQNPITAKAA